MSHLLAGHGVGISIRVTLRRIQKPLRESSHFVSLNIPFLVKGTKKVSFISLQ